MMSHSAPVVEAFQGRGGSKNQFLKAHRFGTMPTKRSGMTGEGR